MDFYRIATKIDRNMKTEVYPDFIVGKHEDIMVRGGKFYAIWDEVVGLWSRSEFRAKEIIDSELYKYAKENIQGEYYISSLVSYETGMWEKFIKFIKSMPDNWEELDKTITFRDTVVTKSDYVSRRTNYTPTSGVPEAYLELTRTLYNPDEIRKIEWAIGCILMGDSRSIQKFLVLYGASGTGKSTIINVMEKLFDGFYDAFDAKSLGSGSNQFALSVFKNNPLVAIQHDGDLSRIEDNTRLNSITSHEIMTINEKNKALYSSVINSFLIMGTNTPVKITDAKSGIIRRLIDVQPSGRLLDGDKYFELIDKIPFELGEIAFHCMEQYRQMGKRCYNSYKPYSMMFHTDVFFNFVDEHDTIFENMEYVTLAQAYEMYKIYCEDSKLRTIPRYRFREQLKDYFKEFDERLTNNRGERLRSVYSGFKIKKKNTFVNNGYTPPPTKTWIILEEETSLFDEVRKDCPAQYSNDNGTPFNKWENINETLQEINTKELHYVRLPENHIVIDFDLKNSEGEKDRELNLRAASKWPQTYAEYSKSGNGVHLHYIYDGDTSKLSRVFDKDIEIKIFTGKSSLRRMLTKCNNLEIAHINSGLPVKGGRVIDFDGVKNEEGIRTLIKNNLKKKYHAGTKPSVDFIHKILEEAYESGVKYDIRDMRPKIMAFATNSTNQAEYCVKLVSEMKFNSKDQDKYSHLDIPPYSMRPKEVSEDELVFFDVEVFPNLFVVCWKTRKSDVVTMINPTPEEMETLFKLPLVGFNCRRYDNHILYARYLGYTLEELYKYSQNIIKGSKNTMFGHAYGISYTDIYEYLSDPKSLKKLEIELGINHLELGLPWDQPVPEELWDKVAEYCGNDVEATEAVFFKKKADWGVRKLLADLAGLSYNDSTTNILARIMFGNDKNPQTKFVYTDLSETFPGYVFDFGKSTYRGEKPSEGGYVYTEPGLHQNVALVDVASMHPTSLELLNLFGDEYTKRYSEIKQARLHIKHGEIEEGGRMLGGILAPYLADESLHNALNKALKLVINRIYGLTFTPYPNPFKDPRNKDNIVAKRGALFMVDLKHAVQEQGFQVAHIKTDSIKIPEATPEIIDFVSEFGEKYGYEFEHEATYDKMILKDKAIYIAHDEKGWHATGAQFSHPYVFKKMFSNEEITLKDLKETKQVQSAIYTGLDNPKEYTFVGKIGQFIPVKERGAYLWRVDGNDKNKYSHVNGTKDHMWQEANVFEAIGNTDNVDYSYYDNLVQKATEVIEKYTDTEWFRKEN